MSSQGRKELAEGIYIFQTNRMIKSMVCLLIIDNGSFGNLVLGLITEPHPHPYRVGWVKKKNENRIE